MMRVRSIWLVALVGAILLVSSPQPATASSSGAFTDDDNSRYEPFIESAVGYGLTDSCNPPESDRFCPNHMVTRGTLALMLSRAVGAHAGTGDHFFDDNDHEAEAAIEALTAAGVPMGCDVERSCPDSAVTRAEMAGLIAAALDWDLSTSNTRYRDVADTDHSGALAELANRGALEACDAPVGRELCPNRLVKRGEAAFAVVAALGLSPETVTKPSEVQARIGFGDSFDELSLWDGGAPGDNNRVKLTEHGFRSSALRVTIESGSHNGADFRLNLRETAGNEPEQLYFRYFLRLDPDWAPELGGKLPGFSGIYGKSGLGGHPSLPDDPGWSARLMFSPTQDGDSRTPLGYYVYHLGQEQKYGDGLQWNEAGKLNPGEWYCLEGEVELNTPGLADGALRAWVDGTPAFDDAGLEFRRPQEPEIRIDSFWFNVFYGGKGVPERDLGLTIDEVVVDTKRIGCDVGSGITTPSSGDFDADGYLDRVWWDSCPGGTCFWLERSGSSTSEPTIQQIGDGAWFSLETHRLGLSTGDVDGDGRADVVYRGRCEGSVRCWRVHEMTGGRLAGGQDWGDEAWFSAKTTSLTLGDWNGDGLDDLAYRGACGPEGRSCWRVHHSTGGEFAGPLNGGDAVLEPLQAVAADVTGDGLEDLVYQSPCGHSTCWIMQESRGSAFAAPANIGRVTASELQGLTMIDFDGNGATDFVSWDERHGTSRIWIRHIERRGIGPAVLLTEVEGRVEDVLLRRVVPGTPVQAIVEVECSLDRSCYEYLVGAAPGRLTRPYRMEVPAEDWSGMAGIA